jgi:tetratricopeptide (TPR) repeat protein
VLAENADFRSSFTASTDDKGRFVIIGLRAGAWRFIAQAPGFAPDVGQMSVRSGGPNPPITFALKRTGPAWSGAFGGIAARDLQADLAAAGALFDKQQWDEAIMAYRTILNKAPSLRVVNLQIAAAYRGKKDFDSAIAAYGEIIKADPVNERAVLGMAATHAERGDNALAEETLARAAAAEGAGRKVFFRLADLRAAGGRTDDARAWYEKASAADPFWGKPLYKLGMLAQASGDPAAAAKYFARVLAVDPVSPEAGQAKTALAQLNK